MSEESKVNPCKCPTCSVQTQERNKREKEILSKYSCKNSTIQIFIKTLTGTTYTLDAHPDDHIIAVKVKLAGKSGYPCDKQKIVFDSKQLGDADHKTLKDLNIKHESTLHWILRLKGGGLSGVQYDIQKEVIVFGQNTYNYKKFEIPSFHISCRSDRFNGENMAGLVLYAYDNKHDWRLNGIHCKSGYIVLKLSKNIDKIQSTKGVVHGKCYKSVFGVEIDSKIIGGGFALVKGKWRFNSYTFNVASKYHDDTKAMHLMEQQCILAAVENWKKGIQNTYCKDIAKKYNGSCHSHGFY